jgi:hypothetical protein
LYINPYYVVTELQGGDKVSKHYYMNTQRVATDISINYQGPMLKWRRRDSNPRPLDCQSGVLI